MATFHLTPAWQQVAAAPGSGEYDVELQTFGSVMVMTGTSLPGATDLGIELDEGHVRTFGLTPPDNLYARTSSLTPGTTTSLAVMDGFVPR